MNFRSIARLIAAAFVASTYSIALAQSPGTITLVKQTPVNVQTDTDLGTMTPSSPVSITSNLICGGAVWSLQYQGVEYVNRHDYGRLIQSAFFAQPSGMGGSGPIYNPTEGGAAYVQGSNPLVEMGSYCDDYENSPLDNTYYTYSSATEFLPNDFGGNTNGTAVYYTGMALGKYIYQNVLGNAAILEYEAFVISGATYSSNAWATVPAIYVRASYSEIYEWSAAHGAVANSWPALGDSYGYPSNLHYPTTSGGLIVVDPSTGYALGVYMPLIPFGGSLLNFSWWNFNDGSGTTPTSNACYAIYPAYGYSFQAGQRTYFRVYLCMGSSLTQVASEMALLQSNNVK